MTQTGLHLDVLKLPFFFFFYIFVNRWQMQPMICMNVRVSLHILNNHYLRRITKILLGKKPHKHISKWQNRAEIRRDEIIQHLNLGMPFIKDKTSFMSMQKMRKIRAYCLAEWKPQQPRLCQLSGVIKESYNSGSHHSLQNKTPIQ